MARISLIGAGAVGSLWANALAHRGHEITLLGHRPLPSEQLSLRLTQPGNQQRTFTMPYYSPAQAPQQVMADCQLLLITTKAYQVANALAPWQSRLPTGVPVILMHNGMGSLDELSLPPQQPVLLATTSHGALMMATDKTATTKDITHTGIGQTYLGKVQGELDSKQQQQLVSWLDNALPPAHWCENIEQELWFKLAVNCAINPLTALHQCRNGELAKPSYRAQISRICREIAVVMNRLDIGVSAEQLQQRVEQVTKQTAANYSSMLQDVRHGRQTEIDYISGYVVREAKRLGVSAPENQRLWKTIRELEATTAP